MTEHPPGEPGECEPDGTGIPVTDIPGTGHRSPGDDGPVEQPSRQVEGRPEREKQAEPAQQQHRRRRPRRAVRGGTNPSAEDVPDVVAPRDEPAEGETPHDRWLREQRPPHWE